MGTIRFIGITFGLFCAVFLGMKWMLTVRPLQPDARLPTFQRINADDPRYKLEQSSVSDNDAVRDRLRNDVIDYAKALNDDPCNKILKAHYIQAVVAYARAWLSIVPCLATQSCGSWDSALLDRGARAFGSPLDHRVRDAMRAVQAKAGFGSADFPKDTIHLVADLAADSSLEPVHDTREFRHVSAGLDDYSRRQDCGR